MSNAFGRVDWLANGVLFAAYHVHMADAEHPVRHARLLAAHQVLPQALIGIIVHSSQEHRALLPRAAVVLQSCCPSII